MTINIVEGFHSLALKYHGNKIDFYHTHYICKTNMVRYKHFCPKLTFLEPWAIVEAGLLVAFLDFNKMLAKQSLS